MILVVVRKQFLFLLLLLACNSSENRILVKNSGQAQGTFYHIQYLSYNRMDYKTQIDSIFLEIDSSLSIYEEYSLISKLNKGENIRTDLFFSDVYHAATRVFDETEGAFDCSIFPLVEKWGFYNQTSLSELNILDSLEFKKMLKVVGFDKINLIKDSLILPKGMALDFNAIAQGYTVDVISRFLESQGSRDYLVEVGGEILAKGLNADRKVWRVGIDKPTDNIDPNERFMFILNLHNKALATSGSYRRFYEKNGIKYSHTIDPATGFPVQNKLLSVTVIHDSCMLADAYATAFMVMGVRKTKKFVENNTDLDVYLIYTGKDGSWKTFISEGMQDRIIN